MLLLPIMQSMMRHWQTELTADEWFEFAELRGRDYRFLTFLAAFARFVILRETVRELFFAFLRRLSPFAIMDSF